MKNKPNTNESEVLELFSELFPDLEFTFYDEDENRIEINCHKNNKKKFHEWLEDYEIKLD